MGYVLCFFISQDISRFCIHKMMILMYAWK